MMNNEEYRKFVALLKINFEKLVWTDREGRCSIQADFLENYLIVAIKGHQGSGYAKFIWVQDKRINNEIILEIPSEELVKKAYLVHGSNKEKSREEFINLINENN